MPMKEFPYSIFQACFSYLISNLCSVTELMRTFFPHVAQLVAPNSKMKTKEVYKRFVLHGAVPPPKSVMKGSCRSSQ